jgi:hypothetical protein
VATQAAVGRVDLLAGLPQLRLPAARELVLLPVTTDSATPMPDPSPEGLGAATIITSPTACSLAPSPLLPVTTVAPTT